MSVTITVWAPNARTADLLVGGERIPMLLHDGRFTAVMEAGTDYLISLDGGDGVPDPRSAWQPHGVHGPSRAFDPGAHPWQDGDWTGRDVLGSVMYEVHVGTFTPEGTLDGAATKLAYLRDLGVDVVELMPLAAFPGQRGWGYDGVDLYAVHHAYGGPAALQRFVDAAHAHDVAVCLDVVYNHLGPSGNYLAQFGPYLTDRNPTPWGDGPDFDGPESRSVRDFVIDNALWWLREFHIDGLRLDAGHAIVDRSPVHILAELSDRVAALRALLGRPLFLVAESDLNDAAMVLPTAAGGFGMDAQWADDVHHALHSYLSGETFGYYVDFGSAETLEHALTEVFVHNGTWSTFRGEPWGHPVPAEADRRRFVTFTQNHDQVGNRALGDRPDRSWPPGLVAAGAAVLLLSPFTPMLFQGQEWGSRTPFQFFTDHDPELGALVSEGRRREFAEHGWDVIYGGAVEVPNPQDPATFERSRLRWEDLDDAHHAAMLRWYRDLLVLRRAEFGDGAADQAVDVDHGDGWFRMARGRLSLVFTTTDRDREVPEPAGDVLVTGFGQASVAPDGVVRLGPHSVAVLRRATE